MNYVAIVEVRKKVTLPTPCGATKPAKMLKQHAQKAVTAVHINSSLKSEPLFVLNLKLREMHWCYVVERKPF